MIGKLGTVRITPPDSKHPDLKWALAQLRHAYSHLAAERVINQREFADGLIAPVIRFLEKHNG